MRRIVFLLLTVSLIAVLSVAITTAKEKDKPQQSPFVGAWESNDVDGSHQWMWIEADVGGVYAITYYDDSASGCGPLPVPDAPPTVGFGGGTIGDPNADDVLNSSLTFWCLYEQPRVPPDWGEQDDLHIQYDQSTDNLILWVTWYRSNDKAKFILP